MVLDLEGIGADQAARELLDLRGNSRFVVFDRRFADAKECLRGLDNDKYVVCPKRIDDDGANGGYLNGAIPL